MTVGTRFYKLNESYWEREETESGNLLKGICHQLIVDDPNLTATSFIKKIKYYPWDKITRSNGNWVVLAKDLPSVSNRQAIEFAMTIYDICTADAIDLIYRRKVFFPYKNLFTGYIVETRFVDAEKRDTVTKSKRRYYFASRFIGDPILLRKKINNFSPNYHVADGYFWFEAGEVASLRPNFIDEVISALDTMSNETQFILPRDVFLLSGFPIVDKAKLLKEAIEERGEKSSQKFRKKLKRRIEKAASSEDPIKELQKTLRWSYYTPQQRCLLSFANYIRGWNVVDLYNKFSK